MSQQQPKKALGQIIKNKLYQTPIDRPNICLRIYFSLLLNLGQYIVKRGTSRNTLTSGYISH